MYRRLYRGSTLQFAAVEATRRASLKDALLGRFASREATIAVIGLGYVGLPLVLGFHAKGFRLLGFDIDAAKIDALSGGRSYLGHIPSSKIGQLVTSGRFHATQNFASLASADAIVICVPTPLTKQLDPDMSYVVSTCEATARHLRPGQLVVLESTTYPGTTRELVEPILEAGSTLKAHTDFLVGYSPEREDPGNLDFQTEAIPKVVGAGSADALEVTAALYACLAPKVVPVSNTETAEAVKLTENIFRAVNIAMVNELKLIFEPMGIDIWEVIEAAKSKPFGYMPFYPGPGLGGHCIPIDPFYLTWKAREHGMATRFIELAGQINRNMPIHVVTKVREALSEHQQRSLHGAQVLVVGVSYKKNVDDMRESPALTLISLLEKGGAKTEYYDPHVPEISMTREHSPLAGRRSIRWAPDHLAKFDATLIATDHDAIDWRTLATRSRLIIDTRNVMARVDLGASEGKIVKA